MQQKQSRKNDKALVAAERDSELARIEQRLPVLQQHTKWDLPHANKKALRDAELDAWIADKAYQNEVKTVELGFGFALKKAQLPHGMFESWVKSTGYAPRTVQRAMQIAVMVLSLPQPKSATVALLPTRKQAEIAAMPQAIREAFLDEFTDEQIQQMKLEDMAEYKAMQKRIANLETNLEATHAQLAARKKQKGPAWPNSVIDCRMESSVLSEQAIGCIQSIQVDVQALMSAKDLSTKRAERDEQIRAGIAPAYTNLLGIAAELYQLIEYIEQSFDEGVLPTRPEDIELLTPEEIQEFNSKRASMLADIQSDKSARASARMASGKTKRPRGRQTGSGKKSSK